MARIKTRSSKRITQKVDDSENKTLGDAFNTVKQYIDNELNKKPTSDVKGSGNSNVVSDNSSMFKRQFKSIDDLTGAIFKLNDSLSDFYRVNQESGKTIIKNTKDTADNVEVVWEDQGKVLEGITNNNDLLKQGLMQINKSLNYINSSLNSFIIKLNPANLNKNIQNIADTSKFDRTNYTDDYDLDSLKMDDELHKMIATAIEEEKNKEPKPDPEKNKEKEQINKGADKTLFNSFLKMFKINSEKREDQNKKRTKMFKDFTSSFIRDSIIVNSALKKGNKKLDAIKLGFIDLRTILVLNAIRGTIGKVLTFFRSPLGRTVMTLGASYLIGKYINEAASTLLDDVQSRSPQFVKDFMDKFRKTINKFFDDISFGNGSALEAVISGLIGLKLSKYILKVSIKFVGHLFKLLNNGMKSVFSVKNIKSLWEKIKTGATKITEKSIEAIESIGSKAASTIKKSYDAIKESNVVKYGKDLFKSFGSVSEKEAVKEGAKGGVRAAIKVFAEKYGAKFLGKEVLKTAAGGLETGSGVGAALGAATLASTIVDLTNMTRDLIKAYQNKPTPDLKPKVSPTPNNTAKETSDYLKRLHENSAPSGNTTIDSSTTSTQTQNNNYTVDTTPINTGAHRVRLDNVEAAL